MDKYEKLAEKSEKLDALMEVVENTELLLLANQAEMSPTVPFEEILKKRELLKKSWRNFQKVWIWHEVGDTDDKRSNKTI